MLHFEDLPLGEEWTTRGRTITEGDLASYITMAGDYNPLYADAHYASGGPQKGVVLPGTMISAVALGLGTMDMPIPATVALVGMTWRYLHPVRLGDTVRAHWRLGRKRQVDNPSWGLAVWQVEVTNQDSTVVASGEIARLVERRPEPEISLEPEPAPAPQPERPPARRRRRRSSRGPRPAVKEGGQGSPPPTPPHEAGFAGTPDAGEGG
jgi:acyl dehydratase